MTQELQNKRIGYYQKDNKIIDYNIVYLKEVNLWVRLPIPYSLEEGKYFCCIGAAQTFGRFVKKPYPEILSEYLDLPVLNLGRGGAGPSYFSQQKKVIDILNKAKFVIVQIMSGRSVNNSLFNDPDNLNHFFTPFSGDKRILSGKAWEFVFKNFSKKQVLSLVEENRQCWIEEMIYLLQLINKPKILLYYSTRNPKYLISFDTQRLSDLWGGFPQLVNDEMIEKLIPYTNSYLEVVSNKGLPQPLYLQDGSLASISFGVSDTKQSYNNYYPSPEMHLECAEKILENIYSSSIICQKENSCLTKSQIELLLQNSTNSFNYPNILNLPKEFREKTCIVCDIAERLFIQSRTKKNILITNIKNFPRVIRRENVDKILIISINNTLEYKANISEYLANHHMSVPVYNWFSDVLTNLSVKKSINFKAEKIQGESKLLAILCTPRSGSQMLCDLMSQTKAFGYPKEHLTMPIVLPAEYNILDLDDWFSKLIAANRTENNVCSTKLIANRVSKLIDSIQKDKIITHLKKFKFLVLKRKNVFAQAISLYFAQKNNHWHVNKEDNTKKNNNINYKYKEIENIYLDLIQQEKDIAQIITKVTVDSSNILNFYYEDIVDYKKDCLKKLADFMGIEFQDSWITLESNLTRISSESKTKIENRFRQDFLAKTQS